MTEPRKNPLMGFSRVLRRKVARPHFELAWPATFYANAKRVTGRLTQQQVDTINGLLLACKDWPLSWTAYALATPWHEARFIPQREWGRGRGRKYGRKGKYGQVPYGRGLVQLTWDYNYEWADERLGLDGALLRNFDLALDPQISARILVVGMEEGAFNPRKKGIADYLPNIGHADLAEFAAARWLVNLNDKAEQIAEYALSFQSALDTGGWAK